MTRRLLWLLSGAFALSALGVAGGCALVEERAEALFLRQQDAQSELVNTVALLELKRPALAERFYVLEDELDNACRALREASHRRFSGKELGSGLEWSIMTSLSECESATSTVETWVQQAQASELRLLTASGTTPASFETW